MLSVGPRIVAAPDGRLRTVAVEPETVERLLDEGAKPVSRLVGLLPAVRGKARDPWTLVRWIKDGKDGIRLEGFTGPDGAWWSSKAALARFLAALTEGPRPSAAEEKSRQRGEAAMAELRRMVGR